MAHITASSRSRSRNRGLRVGAANERVDGEPFGAGQAIAPSAVRRWREADPRMSLGGRVRPSWGITLIRALFLAIVLAIGAGGLAGAKTPHSALKHCKHGVRCGIACIPKGAVCHKPKI